MEQDKYNDAILTGLALVVFLLKFTFTLWDKSDVLEQFFLYDPQVMTKPAYVDYFSDCLTYVIIFAALMFLVPKSKEYISWILAVWVGYLIEYYYRYNQPFVKYPIFWGLSLPVGYSFGAAVFLMIIFVRALINIKKR